ncbi:MAG: protease complex subunit PrcB family protein [Lachnospiraceae bacterium]|nr:protease complex subunit PrcB family protein [Lachnospiraceae bacterium]
MKKRNRIKRLLLFFAVMPLCMTIGCGGEKEEYTKTGDVEFTVVEEADVPTELLDVIKEKKNEAFKLTYLAEDALYLATGYGEQPSGGYSIAVDELFMAKEGVCLKTTLIGPAADEKVTTALTYPYIVIKLQKMETQVHFLE